MTLQPTSKALSALKKVLESVGMPHLYQKILSAGTKQQKRQATIETFKAMAGKISKEDMPAVRQLNELVAQIDNEELRAQLEGVMQSLFAPTKQKGGPFYQTELQKPKPFDYSIFHKSNGQHKSIFARMFSK